MLNTQEAINSDKITTIYDMQQFIEPANDKLETTFITSFKDFISFWKIIDRIKFGLFISFLILFFLFLWVPYISRLNKRIWMTKGMLNMIPLDLILKHSKLREAFKNIGIAKAVR
jgi:hypothetical protein